MEIIVSLVQELRQQTGAGMMDCKKALTEAGGDLERAAEILRVKGLAQASKRLGREAKEGIIQAKVSDEKDLAVLVEVNCETDFVARTEDFRAFTENICGHLFTDVSVSSVEKLLEDKLLLKGIPLREALTELAVKTGENVGIRRFVRMDLRGAGGYVEAYVHPNNRVGTLVYLKIGKAETRRSPRLADLAKDLLHHIAFASPSFLSRKDVSDDVIEREKRIYREQAQTLGKPENIIEKIVGGKVESFFKESCLLEQAFVKDEKKSISKLIEETERSLNDQVEVTGFARFQLGSE